MRIPLKKQSPSILHIVLFFVVFGSANLLVSSVFLPIVNSPGETGLLFALILLTLASYLFSWLRDPGYVISKPNPNFLVPVNDPRDI